MSNEKIEILENIQSSEELKNVTANILTRMNIEVIENKESYLIGEMKSALGSQRVLVLNTIDYLGRNYSLYEVVKEGIVKLIAKGSFNSVILASSKNITEGFRERLGKDLKSIPIDYWDREILIKRIDEVFEDFWRHNDQDLIAYESSFQEELNNDWSITRIKQFKGAHEKLLKIFVEPRLLHKVTDRESPRKALVKVVFDDLKDFANPVMLQGEPGIGKTRLLKQIGLDFIKLNTRKSGFKYVPIFINNIDLIETRSTPTDLIDVIKAIEIKIGNRFNIPLADALQKYCLVLLIDSIDDFNKDNQQKLLKDLKSIHGDRVKIFFGSRYYEYSAISGVTEFGKCEEVYVEKFSDAQIRLFLSLYFKNDKGKAENLLDSLKENAIIQRLPITPLNLSLISILFEENNFEIPATITDIYDNFSNLLLGRALPDSRFDFFDITIRERILSVYSYELLKRGERSYMSVEDFKDFFKTFFSNVSGTINLDLLPDALDFLVNNTGLLVIQDGKYVKFMHESYMEYYASREIFNYRREDEHFLVESFLETSWQYAAIFYAGRTKQMNEFLKSIIARTKKANKSHEFYRSVHGLGYISQALYMSDNSLRKEAVDQAIVATIELYELMKKLGADEKLFFKNLSMPLAAVITSMIFFDGFNSITLKKPLELSFEESLLKLDVVIDGKPVMDYNVAYKLFTIALTLASPRLGNVEPMKRLIYDTTILNDPMFERLLDFGLSVAGSKALYELKDSFKKPSKKVKPNEIVKYNQNADELYLTAPIGRLRYGQYDRIYPRRGVLLLTEGKTDAQLIEHAFMILTDQVPYWEINPVHEVNGGTMELAKCLENGAPIIKGRQLKVIGIFDNDEAGNREFKGQLKESKFDFFEQSKRIKKHRDQDIFGLKLPIPPFREHYYQEDQKFNFFSIEHYFDDELLRNNNMLVATPIPNIFRISDNHKTAFSKAVRNITDKKVFRHFIYLFQEIDRIAGIDDIVYNLE